MASLEPTVASSVAARAGTGTRPAAGTGTLDGVVLRKLQPAATSKLPNQARRSMRNVGQVVHCSTTYDDNSCCMRLVG